MNRTKSGQKSISDKPKTADLTPVNHDDIYSNPLKLPKELEDELDKKNLVPRFISAKELYKNQGYHKAGWRPYKRRYDTMEKPERDFHQGSDPEGIIRRGDCILAVKSKEEVQRHKRFLAVKAERYKDYNRQQADELRKIAKEHGGAVIHEGYEEN